MASVFPKYFPLRTIRSDWLSLPPVSSANLQTGLPSLSGFRMATTKIIALPWAVYHVTRRLGGGCATIAFVEVLVVCLVMQHVPYCDEQLAGHRHEDFHLVLPADYGLVVREPAEEAVLCPARSPCALDDGLAEIHIAVGDPS